MFSKIDIFEIRKDAVKSMRKDSNIFSFLLIYYIFPAFASVIIFITNYKINTALFGNLLSGISLFSGMLFSIIFIVSNNFNTRKEKIDSKEEENKSYIDRYKTFANELTSLISYTVVKALVIIVLLIISDAANNYVDNTGSSYFDDSFLLLLKFIGAILIFLLYQFLLYIVVILKEMYVMQFDDINRK